jgi:hypothetical protein
MDVLFVNDQFDDLIHSDGELAEQNRKEIEELLDLGPIENVKEVNIGPGADLFVILASINTIVNVFLVGDRIVKGIDGWVEVGKKIKRLWKTDNLISVDKDGASLLAIQYLASIEKIISIQKVDEQEINIVRLDGLFNDRKPNELISKPHGYFVQSYVVNDEKFYIIGIKTSGEVNIIKCFEYGNPYGLTELKIDK